MKVKYSGNGSISTTYNGETYTFDAHNRVQDIPPEAYDFMKMSKHVEAAYLLPYEDTALAEENKKLKEENEALRKENEQLKGRKRARRKKTL